jgi:hypothetical protein
MERWLIVQLTTASQVSADEFMTGRGGRCIYMSRFPYVRPNLINEDMSCKLQFFVKDNVLPRNEVDKFG